MSLFLTGGWLPYNFALLSEAHPHQSALGRPVSPPSWASLPPPTPSLPSRCRRASGLSSLRHTAHFHWPSALHMVTCMSPCYSLNASHPLLPPLCPQLLSQFYSPSSSWEQPLPREGLSGSRTYQNFLLLSLIREMLIRFLSASIASPMSCFKVILLTIEPVL